MSLPFVRLSEEERAEWRSLTPSKELAELIDLADAQCASAIIAAVRSGHKDEAAVLAGKFEAIQILKRALSIRVTPIDIQTEEEFTDPAALWSTTK